MIQFDEAYRPKPIDRKRELEVFGNSYGQLFNDEVVSPSGKAGRYLRWKWASEGIVVIPVSGSRLALTPMYRYPIGAISMEFPRGSCGVGENMDDAAARELREETGFEAIELSSVGVLHAETGLIEDEVHVFAATVDEYRPRQVQAEVMESVADPVWLGSCDFSKWIQEGRIKCGITLAAVTLWRAMHTS